MDYRRDIDIEECELVYPPKEDTFLLLEALSAAPGEKVLEMGCGTGLISCHLSAAGCSLTAADLNHRAVECTRANLRRNGLSGEVVRSDLFERVADQFDLVVFNPPYLAAEDEGPLELSWSGGEEGVDVLGRFLPAAGDHLRPGGRIVVLLSSEMRREALEPLLDHYSRQRLASRRFFFEELWVEDLRPR